MNNILVIIAGIGIIAVVCQVVAWWLKLPAILFLLLAGVVAGPVLGVIDPNALLGDLLFPFISLSVAVILFEGSLTLRFHEIAGLEQVVRRLVTTGVITTWLLIAVVSHWLIGFSWSLALLFGAIVVVTGPTVIVPILRTMRPNATIANILRWEGIIIDPVGALLAVLVFEFIVSAQDGDPILHTLSVFGQVILLGSLLGAASGGFLGLILRRHLLPEFLHNLVTLALVLGLYALSNHLAEESGLLAVTVMGIWLANMKDVHVEDILDFKESLSLILISVLFILLAARIEIEQLQQLGWTAAGVFLAIQFVVRPVKIALASWGSSLNWRERAALSWIAPRGIVAAAVSALFALRLEEKGFEQAPLLVPLTFLVIVGTVILQSATARPLARMLGVAEPEPHGFLIVGANPVARAIAKALQDQDFRVLLADQSWDNVSKARLEGLRAFYGKPVSEYADRHLDLVGLGRLLALSPDDDLNALASLRYRPEFGQQELYSLAPATGKKNGNGDKRSAKRFAKLLFSETATYAKFASLLSQGAEVRVTQLSEQFDFDAMRETHGKDMLPLFGLTPKGRLRIFTVGGEQMPGNDWKIISLIPKAEPKADSGA